MKIRINVKLILRLAFAAVFTGSTAALAQSASTPMNKPHAEIALDYSYLRSNAPVGDCGCFNLNGGSTTFAWLFGQRNFALVGDVTVAHANAITQGEYGLTLSTFTAGGRYAPRLGHSALRPFGQVLAGVAHSSGSLVEGPNSAASNAGAAFAANAGGGMDMRVSRHFSIRLAEVDYLVTTFKNGVNDHQNNLRVSTGVVLHF